LLSTCVGAGLLAGLLVAAAGGARLSGTDLTSVASANPKAPGFTAPNILSPELSGSIVAQGSMKLENPSAGVDFYGYLGNGPFVPLPGTTAEAQKTEPDKNTYLVFPKGLKGADPSYDYGTHFLFQGHEAGSPGEITRINLDADGAHRVTLLATQDSNGTDLQPIDGSTWDPWAQRLLFTVEETSTGGAWQATTDVPAGVDNLQPFLGRGAFEGIQNDSKGNVYIAEDASGSSGTGANASAKRPNSYLFRFLPVDPGDLRKGGKIQALQVSTTGAGAHPITFGVNQTADQVINSPDYTALHQYGSTFPAKWIDIATTFSGSTLPGPDDNLLARAAGATPFKRPENFQFRPGSKFIEIFFDETGDTSASSSANGVSGGWGSIFKLTQSPTSNNASISTFFNGDQEHASFDNVAFFDRDHVAFVEDRGDGLHADANALDSGWLFDVNADYSNPTNKPVRFLAQGRDASATIDSGLSGTSGFENEGDNEITGIHVSDGDVSKHGILGDGNPNPFQKNGKWRVFYTQQHGDNITYEITRSGSSGND
jgi:hypothetical protein